jgi:Stress responsive A/B Barrel Domain
MLHHVVLFSLKSGHSEELETLLEDLRALRRLPMVKSLICGRNVASSPFDAGLVVDVDGPAELQAYRDDATHRPTLEQLRRISETIAVVDFSD